MIKEISLKLILLIFLVCLQSCNSQSKKSSFIVNTLKKEINIEKAKEESNNNLLLYKKWKLSSTDVEEVFKLSQPISDEEFHDLYEVTPCKYKCNIIYNKKSYILEINSGSYIILKDNKTVKRLGCKSKKCKDFFIFPPQGAEIDEQIVNETYQKILDSLNSSKIEKSKISDIWYGEYTFDNGNYEQSYKKYTIVISNEKSFLYLGDLPACKIICYPEIVDNRLLLHYDNKNTDKSKYDYTIIKNSKNGDILLKIFKNKNKYFINSALINYWNDITHKFDENVNIEVMKK
jgi:hypothetical protein